MIAVILTACLAVWVLTIARTQRRICRDFYSIAPAPALGMIHLAGESGVTMIGPGRISLQTPHGYHGPTLEIRTVPGTLKTYPYDTLSTSGRWTTTHRIAEGSGFDIAFTTPTLPDMPLPPRIRLEFRDDTLTIRTWQAKVANAEWHTGDGY